MNPYNSTGASGINPNTGVQWSKTPASSDVDVNFNEIQNVQNIYFTDGSNYSDATTTNAGIIASIQSDVNNLFYPPMATYYKDTSQNLTSGTGVGITFEQSKSWSDTTLITQTSPTDFTVIQSGIYQLELNVSVVPNGATWTDFSKRILITIDRNGTDRAIASNFGYASSGSSYILSLCFSYELLENDIINCKIFSSHTGTPLITSPNPNDAFDLDTYFTWRIVSKNFTPP